MLTRMVQGLIDGVATIIDVAASLPLSPFRQFNQIMLENDLLAAISWLVPIPAILQLFQAWLVAIGIWYLAKVPLRWMKVIQ